MNTIPKNFWPLAITVLAVLAALLAALAVKELKSIAYVGKSDSVVNTLTVTGKGEVLNKPDIATFSFSVTEMAKTVAEAQTAAAKKIDAALAAVRAGGVAEKDIKTTSYTVNPHYEYQEGVCITNGPCRPGKSVLDGYEASQSIQVKVRDLDKAGALFGSIGSSGVQNVNGLSFSIDDIDKVKANARAQAIADAKSKADALARQLGVSLVRIVSFSDDGGQYPIYAAGDSFTMKAMAVAAPAPQVPAGEQNVTSTVSVTYEIR